MDVYYVGEERELKIIIGQSQKLTNGRIEADAGEEGDIHRLSQDDRKLYVGEQKT